MQTGAESVRQQKPAPAQSVAAAAPAPKEVNGIINGMPGPDGPKAGFSAGFES